MTFSVAIENHQKINNFADLYSEEEKTPSYPNIFSKYVSNASGPYRFFKLLSHSCKWTLRLGNKLCWHSSTLNTIFKTGKNFHLVSKNLLLTKIPHSVVELNKSYHDYKKASDNDALRKRDSLARKIVENIADFSFLVQLGELLSLYTLGTILSPSVQFSGSLFLLFQYSLGLKMESEDVIEHNKMRKEVENQKYPVERVKKILHEIKNLDFLKLAKTISCLAATILFLLELTFKIVLLSNSSFLLIATVSTILAIWENCYRESMTYQLIKR